MRRNSEVYMKWIFFIVLLVPLTCSANWFGPKTYEDCIIQGMKGTTSNVAAQEIKKACRTKFPTPPKPKAKTQKITGLAANQALNNLRLSSAPNYFGKSDTDHKVEFHNPLEMWVTSITIEVRINDNEPIFYKTSANVKPLATGIAYFGIGLSEKSKITAWRVHEIEVSDQDPRVF